MTAIKQFSKDTMIYGLGRGIKKFIGFFLLPFYTRAMNPSDYGILDTLTTAVFFATAVLNVGLDSASARYFFMAKTDDEKGRVLFTVLTLRLITVIPAIIMSLFSEQISIALFKTNEYSFIVFLSCMSLPLSLLVNEQEHIYRYFREPWRFNLITIVKVATSIGVGITLVVIMKKGLTGAQVASFTSNLFLFLFSFTIFTRRKYNYRFSIYWAKRMLRFGYPLIWAGIASWVFISSSRFFILYYHSTTDVGLYSVGSKLTRIMNIINMAVQMSAGPLFMSWYEKEKESDKPYTKRSFTQIWYMYLIVVISISLFISIFSVDLMRILTTPAYVMGSLAIPFFLFSLIFSQSIQLTGIGISLKEKTGHLAWILSVVAIINVGLNFYFVPKFSFVGAAFTTFFANMIYLIIIYNISQKYFNIRRKVIRIILFFGFSFIIAIFFPFAQLKYNLYISVSIKLLILLLGLSLPFLLKIINIHQVQQFVLDLKKK